MSKTEIKLDSAAMDRLFPEGTEARVELQQSVVQNLGSFIYTWINEQDPNKRLMNDKSFIQDFIKAVNSFDDFSKFSFDGENCYGGRQITIDLTDGYLQRHPKFEIAYTITSLVVYNANHNGYWVQPFISVSRDEQEYDQIMTALRSMMRRVIGL